MDRAQAASTPAEDGEPLETGFVPSPFWQAPQSIANAQALRPVPSFTGRERELGQLDAALWEQTGQVAITGLGGIGKSALAREYARRNRDRYAAVWSLDAETEAGIIDGLVRLGSEFVPSLAKAEDRRNAAEHAVANVLSGLTKPVLLIFDNLDDERLLRAWSPRGAAHTLVTSRHAMPGGDLVVVRLDALAADEAVQYLQREAGRADLTAADALLITQALGYLPLALAHAAAYLKGTVNVTAQRYLDRISEHLARTPRGADYDRAVYATFREAIARAESDGPGAAALLALAACYAPDALPEELFDRNATVYPPLRPLIPEASEPPRDLHAAAADPIGREEALGALHRFSLLIFSPESRTYTMHRLVQQAARTLSAADESRWRECAVTTADAGFPTIDFAHWTGCERLLAHARAALEGLPGVTCNPPAARLALRCGQYLRKRAAYADAEALLRRGVALAERCDAGGLDGDLAAQLEALAALLRDTNRLVEAEPLARRSVELCEAEAGRNPARLAAALNELAILLHYSNQLVEAEALYRRALKIDEAALGEDHPRIALRLHNLALVLHETNRLEDAQRLLTRALSIDERAHGTEHPDVASDASSLGWLVLQTGRLREAEPMLRRALTIREAAYGKHHPVFAHALGDVAVLLHDAERFDEAEALYRQALRVYETSYGARHPVVAACLNNIAELLADQGRIEEAEALYRRALAGDEATYGSEHVNVARDLNNFAGLLALRGDVAGAQTQLRRALAIFESNYDAGHPRVLAARDNAERLRRHAEGTPNAAGWRYVRRSPSRGLR
jgi:tetratricopeptide (TPR) repeat protein